MGSFLMALSRNYYGSARHGPSQVPYSGVARVIGHHLSFSVFLTFLKFPKGLKERLSKVVCAVHTQFLPYSNFCLISHSSCDAVLTASVPGFHELLIIFPHQIAFIALKYPRENAQCSCFLETQPGNSSMARVLQI